MRHAVVLHSKSTGLWDDAVRNIVVEVFPTTTTQQVSALFREINAAEPVRLVDLQLHDDSQLQSEEAQEESQQAEEVGQQGAGGSDISSVVRSSREGTADGAGKVEQVGSARVDDGTHMDQTELLLQALNAAADELALQYPAMFKPSSRCKPPHLNADVLRDDLFQSGFLQRHPVAARSSAGLLRLLARVNASLAQQAAAATGAGAGASKSQAAAERKAAEQGLYLGLDKAWLYQQHRDEDA
jgi:hypothetical protein